MALEGNVVTPLANKPELWYDAFPYWGAFNELSSSRAFGMSEGFIPYSEITNYLNENSIFMFEKRQRYRRIIMALDSAYISTQSEKSKKEGK